MAPVASAGAVDSRTKSLEGNDFLRRWSSKNIAVEIEALRVARLLFCYSTEVCGAGRRTFAASGTRVQALIASSCLARHAATAFQNSSAVGQSLRSAAAAASRTSLASRPRSFKISNAALKRSNRFHRPRSKFEAALFNLPTKPSTASAARRATAYASR